MQTKTRAVTAAATEKYPRCCPMVGSFSALTVSSVTKRHTHTLMVRTPSRHHRCRIRSGALASKSAFAAAAAADGLVRTVPVLCEAPLAAARMNLLGFVTAVRIWTADGCFHRTDCIGIVGAAAAVVAAVGIERYWVAAAPMAPSSVAAIRCCAADDTYTAAAAVAVAAADTVVGNRMFLGWNPHGSSYSMIVVGR